MSMVIGATAADGFEISFNLPQAHSPVSTIMAHCTLALMAALFCLTIL